MLENKKTYMADSSLLPKILLPKGNESRNGFSKLFTSKPEKWWLKEGEKSALKLFHEVSKRVPAYKKFLKSNGVRPENIKSIDDFSRLPETNKKNYIHKYPLNERLWDGKMSGQAIIAASSGTTGSPTLWPRGMYQEAEAAQVHEQIFVDLYGIDKCKTLAIIGFPMGVYVSGVATALPSFITALKHSNLSVVTAGNNKESVLNVLSSLSSEFEQIILIGHPFFIKDVAESAQEKGIDWSKIKTKCFFVSEGFSEEWRKYVAKVLHVDARRDLLSFYGSSELLLMAYENPETVRVKSAVEVNASLQSKIGITSSQIGVFQNNPVLRYIESNQNHELLFTARSGVPLIRYNLKDFGSVITRTDLAKDFSLKMEGWKAWNLPYIFLGGRSDYAVVFYAANIYPENIHSALNKSRFLHSVTGKFAMEKVYSENMEQKLKVYIELRQGQAIEENLRNSITQELVIELESTNMEYNFLRHNLERDLIPLVELELYQSTSHFAPGLKPKYLL